MVRKLLKHELIALLRIAVVPMAVMLVFAVISRISMAADGETANTVSALSAMLYVFAVLATVSVCWALGVSRFYKSLFTAEGYMTLSLPVTAGQLIWAKLLSSFITMACGIVVCVLSSLIFLIGQAEALAQIANFLSELGTGMNAFFSYDPLLMIEGILFLIISLPTGLLAFYLFISVGQSFTGKNRKGMIVLIGIAVYFAISLFSSFVLEPMYGAAFKVSLHLVIWIMIVLYAAADVLCFLGTRYILKNKVNLIS